MGKGQRTFSKPEEVPAVLDTHRCGAIDLDYLLSPGESMAASLAK